LAAKQSKNDFQWSKMLVVCVKSAGLYTFFEGGQLPASLFLLLQWLFYIRVQSCFWKHFSSL